MSDIWPDCMIATGSEGGAAYSCRGYGALMAERDALRAERDEAVELLREADHDGQDIGGNVELLDRITAFLAKVTP